MTVSPIALVPKKQADDKADNQAIIECLESFLVRARTGDVVGMHAIIQFKDEYEYKRVGISYVEALGMLTRATHALNIDWDSNK